ncbi:IS3 family transposase [Streptomyces sp. NPDC005794]|uniref:IS3 family transposase n=1 Tax=Streptomyces sp. NPDC005794 TaxID=3364733 RepID=UPI0036745B75
MRPECVRGRVFATRAEANLALFEYIDGFYNSRRIQKRLGYLSPIEGTVTLLRFSGRGRWVDGQSCGGKAAVDETGPKLNPA